MVWVVFQKIKRQSSFILQFHQHCHLEIIDLVKRKLRWYFVIACIRLLFVTEPLITVGGHDGQYDNISLVGETNYLLNRFLINYVGFVVCTYIRCYIH